MRVAVIGATGAVGREMLNELEDCSMPIELVALASPRSEGTSLEFKGQYHVVKAFALEHVKGCQFALMSAGGDFSKRHALSISELGVTVIDNSSAWRMKSDVPLIVPEVNKEQLNRSNAKIIANPNCSTIQMLVPLAPLAKKWGLSMVQVATYQSVSGTGQQGIDELSLQVRDSFNLKEPTASVYSQPIAFNILPAIGSIGEDGYCEEEIKMIHETKKILNDPQLEVLATTARVPVFTCHSEAVTIKLKSPVTKAEVEDLWVNSPSISYAGTSELSDLPTSLSVAGSKDVSVSRLRLLSGQDRSEWLQFWITADNLKKGAATNAVQIMEHMCSK